MPGFPETGHCEIAETDYDDNPSRRLIMRLVHVLDEHQQPPFPTWDHHAFVTNRTAPIRDEDLHHRAHAVVELGLRDLKDNGLAHWPSGRFNANAAFPLGELSANTAKAGPAGRPTAVVFRVNGLRGDDFRHRHWGLKALVPAVPRGDDLFV